MKKLKQLTTFVAISCLLTFTFNSSAQSVGINATGATPDKSALLDLSSTDKGFLITRADTANIPTPAFGLMTLAPIDSCLYMYSGATWISIGGVGNDCPCNCSNPGGTPPVFPCNGTVIPVVDVTNPKTGKTWMDRNLGASQVATSSTDVDAYGDLYQWGRCSDGHEKRTSGTVGTQSTTDTPGHPDFITTSTAPRDWRSPQNDNLWQGVAGINNPCPTGYRIPTDPELDAELVSWSSNNATGAFGSPLKLSMSGFRDSNGALGFVGTVGHYWSSTISTTFARSLGFATSSAGMGSSIRAAGFPVRCIKD